jgi:translation initiation factor IF-3
VRLVDDNFKLIGIMDFEEAKQRASTSNKDIVLLNEAVEPPLCRICDYSDELA